jgi:hypothetical protein
MRLRPSVLAGAPPLVAAVLDQRGVLFGEAGLVVEVGEDRVAVVVGAKRPQAVGFVTP